jgi:hypothetical protein
MPSGDSPRSVLRREAASQPERPATEPTPNESAAPQPQPLSQSKVQKPSGPRLLVPVPAAVAEEKSVVVREAAQTADRPVPTAEPDLRISLSNASGERSGVASAVRGTSSSHSVMSTRFAVGEDAADSELNLKGPAASAETITLRAQPAEHVEAQSLRVVRQMNRTANRMSADARPVWSTEMVEPAAAIRR